MSLAGTRTSGQNHILTVFDEVKAFQYLEPFSGIKRKVCK
jgi:hypothetical protein